MIKKTLAMSLFVLAGLNLTGCGSSGAGSASVFAIVTDCSAAGTYCCKGGAAPTQPSDVALCTTAGYSACPADLVNQPWVAGVASATDLCLQK